MFPLLWGRLADRWGRPVSVLRIIAVGCTLSFLPLLGVTGFWPIFAAMALWAMFRVGFIPNLDALCLVEVRGSGGAYGRIRSWGSAGFIAGGLVLGWIVSGTDRSVIPAALVVCLAATAVLVLFVREPAQPRREGSLGPTTQAIGRLLRDPQLRAIYLVSLVSRLSIHGVYGFLPLHLQDLGVDDTWIAWYWAIGVASEIVLIRNADRLFFRRSTRSILTMTLVAGIAQYGLTAWLTNPWFVLPVMAFHGMTFGVWYVASMRHLGQHAPHDDRATAQALFQTSAFGFGATLSAVGAGYLYFAGSGTLLFGVSAALCGVAAIGVAVLFPTDESL